MLNNAMASRTEAKKSLKRLCKPVIGIFFRRSEIALIRLQIEKSKSG